VGGAGLRSPHLTRRGPERTWLAVALAVATALAVADAALEAGGGEPRDDIAIVVLRVPTAATAPTAREGALAGRADW
jgi:hypothetical protein